LSIWIYSLRSFCIRERIYYSPDNINKGIELKYKKLDIRRKMR